MSLKIKMYVAIVCLFVPQFLGAATAAATPEKFTQEDLEFFEYNSAKIPLTSENFVEEKALCKKCYVSFEGSYQQLGACCVCIRLRTTQELVGIIFYSSSQFSGFCLDLVVVHPSFQKINIGTFVIDYLRKTHKLKKNLLEQVAAPVDYCARFDFEDRGEEFEDLEDLEEFEDSTSHGIGPAVDQVCGAVAALSTTQCTAADFDFKEYVPAETPVGADELQEEREFCAQYYLPLAYSYEQCKCSCLSIRRKGTSQVVGVACYAFDVKKKLMDLEFLEVVNNLPQACVIDLMITYLRKKYTFDMVDIYADKTVAPFYQQLGFVNRGGFDGSLICKYQKTYKDLSV